MQFPKPGALHMAYIGAPVGGFFPHRSSFAHFAMATTADISFQRFAERLTHMRLDANTIHKHSIPK